MDETLDTLGKTITGALAASVTGYAVAFGELTVAAQASDIVAAMRFLRDDDRCQFWNLIDITAVDWPSRGRRFDVVYHLLSPKQNARIRVKAETDETTPVPSIIEVFAGADWFERETYDLYGIVFTGHPDMRRILTDYGFEGHPLRKDFPLTGFVEVRRQQLRAHPFHQHDHVTGGEHFWHRRDLRRFRKSVGHRLVLRHLVAEAVRHAGLERGLHDPCPFFAFSSPGST